MAEPLIAPTFLFRFSVDCRQLTTPWSSTAKDLELPPDFHVPSFAELDERQPYAEMRVGWHADGVALSLRVQGKKQGPWCRSTRLEDSDGLHVFFDTRDMHNVHRASRFCHHFVLLPQGSGQKMDQPVARHVRIQRAKEETTMIDPELLKVRSEKRIDGYILSAFIPAKALTGYDPTEHHRLGFCYALLDREQGCQTFAVDPSLPYATDPSLWGTLDLVE